MRKFLRNVFMDETNGNGNDLGGADAITNEAEALASLVGGDTDTSSEVISQSENPNPEAGEETNEDGIDLSKVDLSFLGIEAQNGEQEPGEIVEKPQTKPEDNQPNQMDEILNKLETLSNPNETQAPELPPEEVEAVKDLFGKFQQLGLIPENNGLSEEDKNLLQEAKEIRDGLKAQETEQKEYEAHQTKLSDLEAFSTKLETTIPGYTTDFMQKVVGDINKTNPEAAQKIFNNPSLLLDLWNNVGAKAQPSQEPTGVINSNGQQATKHNDLDEKVNNGTATELEEARWLRGV